MVHEIFRVGKKQYRITRFINTQNKTNLPILEVPTDPKFDSLDYPVYFSNFDTSEEEKSFSSAPLDSEERSTAVLNSENEDVDESDESNAQSDQLRPNFFVSLKIDSLSVVQSLCNFQEQLLNKLPRKMEKKAIESSDFHLTLCLLKLDNVDQEKAAVSALESFKLPRNIELTLKGVKILNGKTIYVGIDDREGDKTKFFYELSCLLYNKLESEGVDPSAFKRFTLPHVTLLKCRERVNKSHFRDLKIADRIFGSQVIRRLELSSVGSFNEGGRKTIGVLQVDN